MTTARLAASGRSVPPPCETYATFRQNTFQNTFETARNPTLVAGALDSPEQWPPTGNVSVAAGTAILGESGAAHVRLAQAMSLAPKTRIPE